MELDALFDACDDFERAVFGTLLLTGLRKSEPYFLTWTNVDFRSGVLSVTGEDKVGFSPKDYEVPRDPHAARRHRDLEAAAADRSMRLPQSQRKTSDAPAKKIEDVSEACWRAERYASQVPTHILHAAAGDWYRHRDGEELDGRTAI